jgi:hypothetical protein
MFSIGYDLYCISSHRPSCYPYYIQAFHVSDVEARQEAHWVESIKIGPAAEPEELGKWTG